MTDNLDFYALRVDGEPASIFVDLGAETLAPITTLTHMAYVSLRLNHPRPDGLSSSEEFEILVAIENSLEETLCGESIAYVGRCTSAGCRDFYFYVASATDWEASVSRVMEVHQGYEYEVGSRKDTEWSVYASFLLPGSVARQSIENRRVCEALESHGDNLSARREIDHWSYFPDESSAESYLAEVQQMGFLLRDKTRNAGISLGFRVQVWRADVPSYQAIDNVTLPLYEAAIRNGGDYDGWECAVVA